MGRCMTLPRDLPNTPRSGPGVSDILPTDTEPVVIAGDDGYQVFSDIPVGRTHRWSPGGGVQTLREETGWGNGNALDLDGSLLT